MRQTRRIRSLCISWIGGIGLAAVIAAAVFTSSPCSGQGTSGTMPDPISTHELKGYADRLKLSDQQRQAANMIHDQYKQEFRTLRQGDIAEFLKEMRSMQGSMMMPRRDVMEATLKKMEQLAGRIATLDNRMFDQVQAILTEDQLGMMSRVRMARQRTRLASNQMMGVTGSPGATNLDLSEMVADLKLTANVEQTIDPGLSSYESKLTAALAKLSDKANNMMIKMFDAMEEMGFSEQSMADPETAAKLGEAMQKIWRDITVDVIDAAGEVTELNQRTYKSLLPLLPEDQRRPLRNRYYARAYPEAGFGLKDDAAYFAAALKAPDLNDDQRTTITTARDTLTSKMDRLVDEAVAMIEAQRKDFSPFDFNSEGMQEHYKKLAELQTSAAEAQRAATETVNTALGPELAKKIGRDVMASAEPSTSVTFGAAMISTSASVEVEGNVEAAQEGAMQHAWSGDQFVPGPIGSHDLTEYAARLKLNDEQQVMFKQLHADYLEQYKVVQEAQIAALTKAVQSMWRFDEKTQTPATPTAESTENTYRLRQEAIAAIKSLDQSFFNDVQTIVLEAKDAPRLARVRLQRERAAYNRGQEVMWGWFGGSNEPKIDLAAFLRQQRLNEQDQAAVDAELAKYEEAATVAFRDRFAAGLEMQKAQELWQIEAMQARNDSEGNAMAFAGKYQEIMGEVTKRVSEQNNVLTKLNREHLERILIALPTETSVRVRDGYNRRAFPNVYNDELSLEGRLMEALKLPDLGPEQRRRINELATEYRPSYTRFCDQMVQIASETAAPNWGMGGDMEGWQKWQERQETLAGVKFDRRELSLRAIATLKSVLSEEQIRAVGGMPEPKEKGPYDEWME